MRRPLALHPLLFYISTIVFTLAHNAGKLPLAEAWLSVLLVLLPALVIQGVLQARGQSRKAAVVVTLFYVLFFSYGQVFLVIEDLQVAGVALGRHGLLMTVWALLMVAGSWCAARVRSDLSMVTRTLNLVGWCVVVMPLATLASHVARGGMLWGAQAPPAAEIPASASAQPAPDIYYIIVDRYGSADTLRDVYGYDNSEFLDFLRQRGFYVASESQSNYLRTAHSLATSLNMEYLDSLARDPGPDSRDWIPVYAHLREYRVWRFLKARGYRFIHFGTRWEPTRVNPNADVNINVFTPHEFVWTLESQSILRPLGLALGIATLDPRLLEWKRIPHQIEQLAEMPKLPGPKFVFVHLLIPHGPYIFDQDGAFLSEKTVKSRSREENYRNSVTYINERLRWVLDRLLAESKQPPVIILQGDEGPPPLRYDVLKDKRKFDWRKATVEELREKAGILNAYYLPGAGPEKLYPAITPVNTFRLVLGHYFGASLALLPDEIFGHTSDAHPYDFFPITERLRRQAQSTPSPAGAPTSQRPAH